VQFQNRISANASQVLDSPDTHFFKQHFQEALDSSIGRCTLSGSFFLFKEVV
jgi:hypothetical protein